MALDTTDEKLSVMEWGLVWAPGLPMVSTGFPTQAHKQAMIGGASAVAWLPIVAPEGRILRQNPMMKTLSKFMNR